MNLIQGHPCRPQLNPARRPKLMSFGILDVLKKQILPVSLRYTQLNPRHVVPSHLWLAQALEMQVQTAGQAVRVNVIVLGVIRDQTLMRRMGSALQPLIPPHELNAAVELNVMGAQSAPDEIVFRVVALVI